MRKDREKPRETHPLNWAERQSNNKEKKIKEKSCKNGDPRPRLGELESWGSDKQKAVWCARRVNAKKKEEKREEFRRSVCGAGRFGRRG